MKIVHVVFRGVVIEGLLYQDNLLPKWHHKNGHDVTVITSRINPNNSNENDYINPDGVRIIRLHMRGSELKPRINARSNFEKFYETLEELRPDILFIHGLVFINLYEISRYLKTHPEVRAYVDNHTDYSNAGLERFTLRALLRKIIIRLFLASCGITSRIRKFYGVLPARVEYLVKYYGIPRKKCELLLMGADDDFVAEAAHLSVRDEIRKKYNVEPLDFLVMTGGKINSTKTQTLFLMEAIRNIKSERVKLIVFGSVAKFLQEKVNELADGVKVQYIGWVEGRSTYKLFAASDLLVFPGRHSVFWEQAAGQGIPMLCKDWEGTHHVDLGGNVKFLTQDSTQEIQVAIEELINSPEEYQRMKRIAAQGMKKFSYREIARQSIEE